jgi:predicted GIY-YIG superfamily endonuclease
MDSSISDHSCYILISEITGKLYIGYTINFNKRIRQHNGEIKGGAKRTSKGRPWVPICIIKGFYDNSSALRFEYRLQKTRNKKDVIKMIFNLIKAGDGTIKWPKLHITWFNTSYRIVYEEVVNYYFLKIKPVTTSSTS